MFVGLVVVSTLTKGVADELEIGITANNAIPNATVVETLIFFLNPELNIFAFFYRGNRLPIPLDKGLTILEIYTLTWEIRSN